MAARNSEEDNAAGDILEGENAAGKHVEDEEDEELLQIFGLLGFGEETPLSSKNFGGMTEQRRSVEKEAQRIADNLKILEESRILELEEELAAVKEKLKNIKAKSEIEITGLVEHIGFLEKGIVNFLQAIANSHSENSQADNVLVLGPFRDAADAAALLKVAKALETQFSNKIENLKTTKNLIKRANTIFARVPENANLEAEIPEVFSTSCAEEANSLERNNDTAEPAPLPSTSRGISREVGVFSNGAIGKLLSQQQSTRGGRRLNNGPHGSDASGRYCVCGSREFASLRTLTYHIRSKTSEYKFRCRFCPHRTLHASGMRQQLLKKHKIVDGNAARTVSCSRCAVQFPSRAAFVSHRNKSACWRSGRQERGQGKGIANTNLRKIPTLLAVSPHSCPTAEGNTTPRTLNEDTPAMAETPVPELDRYGD